MAPAMPWHGAPISGHREDGQCQRDCRGLPGRRKTSTPWTEGLGWRAPVASPRWELGAGTPGLDEHPRVGRAPLGPGGPTLRQLCSSRRSHSQLCLLQAVPDGYLVKYKLSRGISPAGRLSCWVSATHHPGRGPAGRAASGQVPGTSTPATCLPGHTPLRSLQAAGRGAHWLPGSVGVLCFWTGGGDTSSSNGYVPSLAPTLPPVP